LDQQKYHYLGNLIHCVNKTHKNPNRNQQKKAVL